MAEGLTLGAGLGGGGLGFLLGGPLGAGLGLAGGSLLGGMFGKKRQRVQAPDIGGELSRIASLFEEARKAQVATVNEQSGQLRRTAASNLAARGIYSSPVSENTFNEIERGRLSAIGQGAGQLAGQEAGLRAELLQALLGQKLGIDLSEQTRRDQVRGGIFGALGGLLPLLLGMGRGGGTNARRTGI